MKLVDGDLGQIKFVIWDKKIGDLVTHGGLAPPPLSCNLWTHLSAVHLTQY